jgi:hypothetical protein
VYLNGELEGNADVISGEQGLQLLICDWDIFEFGKKECTVLVKATVDGNIYNEYRTVSLGRYDFEEVEFRF